MHKTGTLSEIQDLEQFEHQKWKDPYHHTTTECDKCGDKISSGDRFYGYEKVEEQDGSQVRVTFVACPSCFQEEWNSRKNKSLGYYL